MKCSKLSRLAKGEPAPALPEARNRDILVWVGSGLVPRAFSGVSVFDSSVQGGDAVWEGLRIYDGKVFCLRQHIDRLLDSARMMAFGDIPSRDFIEVRC